MNQSHNISWHLLEANFKFLSQYKGSSNFLSSYFPKDNPHHDISRDLKHFIAKFVSTILTFSETGRSRFPKRIAPLGRGKVFPDMLRDKHPNYLNERNQRIEFWVHCFQAPSTSGWLPLQPVINVLLYENEMEALIMLAQHPDINLREPMLEQEEWYQHGFNRTKELSLSAYIFFCSAQAIGTLENGEYALDREYHCLVDQMDAFSGALVGASRTSRAHARHWGGDQRIQYNRYSCAQGPRTLPEIPQGPLCAALPIRHVCEGVRDRL